MPSNRRQSVRYGVGELYGFDIFALSPQKIRALARAKNTETICPFKPITPAKPAPKCHKPGGACSLRKYRRGSSGSVEVAGPLVIMCPSRFLENGTVFQWVGEVLLDTKSPVVISQLPFLMANSGDEEDPDAVGKIDNVLINPDTATFRWCALEMQAVYFSGAGMKGDMDVMATWEEAGVPFPMGNRRPDFRSSGPKRLMPQLQIKVPTISRWGKKMAVVVDKDFWESLGPMKETRDLSNSEIAWFIVSYASIGARFTLITRRAEFHGLCPWVNG